MSTKRSALREVRKEITERDTELVRGISGVKKLLFILGRVRGETGIRVALSTGATAIVPSERNS